MLTESLTYRLEAQLSFSPSFSLALFNSCVDFLHIYIHLHIYIYLVFSLALATTIVLSRQLMLFRELSLTSLRRDSSKRVTDERTNERIWTDGLHRKAPKSVDLCPTLPLPMDLHPDIYYSKYYRARLLRQSKCLSSFSSRTHIPFSPQLTLEEKEGKRKKNKERNFFIHVLCMCPHQRKGRHAFQLENAKPQGLSNRNQNVRGYSYILHMRDVNDSF